MTRPVLKPSDASPEQIDLLTLIEPLACVQHAYLRLPETLQVESACVLGGGPIGSLHLIELRKRFPQARLQLVDPSHSRRSLCRDLFPDVQTAAAIDHERFDLLIVATSDPAANMTAIRAAGPTGTVVHFSGLNSTEEKKLVVGDIDIESVHRNEEVRILKGGVRLVGSSGYSRSDIHRAIRSLRDHPLIYSRVQTSIVEGIGAFAMTSKNGDSRRFSEPVITRLLRSDDEYLKDLKVVFRVSDSERALQVSARMTSSGSNATMTEQPARKTVAPGFIRLRILRFSICNTDRRVLDGTKIARRTGPLVLGHEGIGVIEDIGRGIADDFSKNSIALILPHLYDTTDPMLKLGVPYLSQQLQHLGVHIDGCFSKYVDLPAQCVLPIQNAQGSGPKV